MMCVCPNPTPWHEAFQRLADYAELHACTPSSPPKPLILTGWACSSDTEKAERWEGTLAWAANNGCSDLLSRIPEQDFYFVHEVTSRAVAPLGGPMHRAWDFERKSRPPTGQLAKRMDALLSSWPEIVGQELANITRPTKFTGAKARRLLVLADAAARPPWGGWSCLSTRESERKVFTGFRAAVNAAIAPHEVDHIDFTTE
jgi:hypothetical protein